MEAILDAARELIGEQGTDAISMRTIARRAGAPISSVYQYFPDKNALLRRLMELYLEQFRAILLADYEGLNSLEEVLAAMPRSVDRYFQFFLDEPAFGMIWTGVQANPILRLLDMQDSQINAQFLAEQLAPFVDEGRRQELLEIVLFLVSMVGSVACLALNVEEPTRAMFIREVKVLIEVRMQRFFAVGEMG